MLRTFLDCKEVKALVGIGCCYNLLSEECFENTGLQCGFPMSDGTKLTGLSLGKIARDLACQSAERWRGLTEDAAIQNFEVHALRAAFQMVLNKYYSEVLIKSPSIGRQGKALRRQQQKRVLQLQQHVEENISIPFVVEQGSCKHDVQDLAMASAGYGTACRQCNEVVAKDDNTDACAVSTDRVPTSGISCTGIHSIEQSGKYAVFEEFSKSGLNHLGLSLPNEIDFMGIWKEALPFSELVGPYWSIRAALGPVVETFLLLDRLLFLQDQGASVEAMMLPLFDPTLSPRNMALIARKIDADATTI